MKSFHSFLDAGKVPWHRNGKRHNSKQPKLISIALFLLVTLFTQFLSAQDTGKIMGKLIAGDTNEPLIFANVVIEGQLLGAASDMDGIFLIENVPAGTYTVIVSIVGYTETRIPDVVVEAGKLATIDDVTVQSETIEGEAVEIVARVIQNNEAALLSQRKKSISISDALSAEAISQSGAGEAADAMQKVTGASVLDGKYVYVRGLGDRYASTQLNGVELPSADPDKRSFQLDLIPAKMLDNIVTLKTFTPDKPGNFSGGIVDLGTRAYPDQLEISFSTGTSWNSQSSFSSEFLSQASGNRDWLGMDDGTRELPDEIQNLDEIPDPLSPDFSEEDAQVLNRVSRAFNSNMSPINNEVPVNSSFGFSIGNKLELFGRPLGFLASVSYKRSYSLYENEFFGSYKLKGQIDTKNELDPETELSDSKGTDDVLWGTIGTLSYEPWAGQQFQINYIRTQGGTASSRFLSGSWQAQDVENLETRALTYSERALNSVQLRGNQEFANFGDLKATWIGSYSSNKLDQPDTRFFGDIFAVRPFMGRDTTIYSIPQAVFDPPSRYFRDTDETSRTFQFNVERPVGVWNNLTAKVKLGYSYEEKDRDFNERIFEYLEGPGSARYQGDPDAYFGGSNIGLNSTTNEFGVYINEGITGALGSVGSYTGDQRINATYLMADIPLTPAIRVIGGARLESTRMNVTNGIDSGSLNDDDVLPSFNLNYQFIRDHFLRLAYGRTLARPNFREKAPYASFNFIGDFIFNGNIDLERTLINNYDVRWEWFMAPGEIIAISGYYKDFKNPIERVIDEESGGENDVIEFRNIESSEVMGLEFEFRKRLGFVASALNNFTINTNMSFTQSEVKIPEEELENIVALDPNADDTRDLVGQSPYLLNVGLTYFRPVSGSSVTLSYNTFGDRLYEIAAGATPDVFERGRHTLDLNLSQQIFKNLTLKLGMKNILDAKNTYSHDFKGQEFIRRQYRSGRQVGLSFSYDL
ncbi:MAG: TonB-dependent receptor domain-containing protein [Calditrichia bacterium]